MKYLSRPASRSSMARISPHFAVAALVGIAHAAPPAIPVPNGTTQALGEVAAAHDDARMEQLVSRRPTFTVIRLDEIGTPQIRMDFFFGGTLPETPQALISLAERFSFDASEGAQSERLDEVARFDLDDWRTVILPEVSAPNGAPQLTSFEQDLDLAIEFRPAVQNLSCKMSWTTTYHGYNHTGWGPTFYAWGVDGVTFAAQARRDKNTNPNLYLDRKVGSSWSFIQSSTQGAWMDWVGGYNTACAARDYRLRVHMANEGYWSCLGVSFKAD